MRKRSTYRPYRTDRSAWAQTINMQQSMSVDQLDDLGLAIHTAIERLRTGLQHDGDWHTLAAMVNVSLILCERGVGAEHERVVKAAQDALMRMHARHQTLVRWGFSGEDLTAINDAATLHEQQIALVPRRDCRDAMLECRRRMQRGQVLNQVSA